MKIEHIKINGTTLARHDLGFEKASTQCIAGFNHNIYPGYVQGNRFSPNARISGRARIYPGDLVTLLLYFDISSLPAIPQNELWKASGGHLHSRINSFLEVIVRPSIRPLLLSQALLSQGLDG